MFVALSLSLSFLAFAASRAASSSGFCVPPPDLLPELLPPGLLPPELLPELLPPDLLPLGVPELPPELLPVSVDPDGIPRPPELLPPELLPVGAVFFC